RQRAQRRLEHLRVDLFLGRELVERNRLQFGQRRRPVVETPLLRGRIDGCKPWLAPPQFLLAPVPLGRVERAEALVCGPAAGLLGRQHRHTGGQEGSKTGYGHAKPQSGHSRQLSTKLQCKCSGQPPSSPLPRWPRPPAVRRPTPRRTPPSTRRASAVTSSASNRPKPRVSVRAPRASGSRSTICRNSSPVSACASRRRTCPSSRSGPTRAC